MLSWSRFNAHMFGAHVSRFLVEYFNFAAHPREFIPKILSCPFSFVTVKMAQQIVGSDLVVEEPRKVKSSSKSDFEKFSNF